MDIYEKRILILDFGSQYTELIARRIREIGVYCAIYPYSMSKDEITHFSPAGIILSGGPESVTLASTSRCEPKVFNLGCPVLGICYGMQTMAQQLGGRVHAAHKREFGFAEVAIVSPASRLLADIEDHARDGVALLDVWMSHGDQVNGLPSGFRLICSTQNCPIAGMADETRHFYGLQFHPEVSHTRQGIRILQRFVLDICACDAQWSLKNIIDDTIAKIQSQAGTDKVILGLSGGVDSSIASVLLHKAIGKQLTCIFVDTGLLRLQEKDQVRHLFADHFGIAIHYVDAKERFFNALMGVCEPEEKRKRIGKTFIEVFEEEAKKIPGVRFLAQGTIYSDVIESAGTKTGKAAIIKSHHNVAGLPDRIELKLLEPLRELFKDEVRKIGLELGLPYELVHRHPFPGPGLGIRIIGEVKPSYVETLRQADAILIDELQQADLYYQVSQAFTVLLPIKSVGVLGDSRHYAEVIAIRIVTTMDFMTATWAKLPHEFLDKVSHRIINEVLGVSRVVYDISNKPPATIEWE